MFRFPSPVTLRLGPGEILTVRRGPRARIAVRDGVVHLTRQGDAEDHFLEPGQSMDLRGSVAVVVEAARADRPVLLSVEFPARSTRLQRGLGWLRRGRVAGSGRIATMAG